MAGQVMGAGELSPRDNDDGLRSHDPLADLALPYS